MTEAVSKRARFFADLFRAVVAVLRDVWIELGRGFAPGWAVAIPIVLFAALYWLVTHRH